MAMRGAWPTVMITRRTVGHGRGGQAFGGALGGVDTTPAAGADICAGTVNITV